MSGLLAELQWRGLVHDATPGLEEHLERQRPVTVYCGFDPTAPSLQLGNLIPLMLLKHFQLAGHRPIVLMGGGTGLIGDPSGKPGERVLLGEDEAHDNVARMRAQMSRFLDFSSNHALLENNADWLVKEPLVDFLRSVGKHFTINIMLQKESVKARLETGLSFTEFSYMLLQAYDYLQLFDKDRCTVQVGGSDQWGNITAGAELIRRTRNAEVHGLVAPLVTTASGAKFGKSESGAIYLDPSMTSPYKFYQFWVNTDDRDAERYLRLFTNKTRHEIHSVVTTHKKNPSARMAQKSLAESVTEMVHGRDTTTNVEAAAAILFGDLDLAETTHAHFDVLAKEIPTLPLRDSADYIPTELLKQEETISLVDGLVGLELAKSKNDARRVIGQGGVEVNRKRVTDVERVLGGADWIANRNILICRGKKNFGLIRLWR